MLTHLSTGVGRIEAKSTLTSSSLGTGKGLTVAPSSTLSCLGTGTENTKVTTAVETLSMLSRLGTEQESEWWLC